MAQQNGGAIYFTKLEIENVRTFGRRQELSLVDSEGRLARWTLIVGENGVGKTTLLQCLARMRPVFTRPPDCGDKGNPPDPVQPELAREKYNTVLNSLVRSGADVSASLSASLTDEVSLGEAAEGKLGNMFTSVHMKRTKGELTKFKSAGRSPDGLEDPLVLAYGAGRHPNTAGFDRVATMGPVDSLFMVAAPLNDPGELLLKLQFRSLRKDRVAKQQLERLKFMLSELLPGIEGPEDIEVLGPLRPHTTDGAGGLQVNTPSGWVKLDQLSLGNWTMFSLAVDMAWKLLEHYPMSGEPLHEPAIAIIDEIDLHLHPRWQREIRQYLTKHFPRTQFIATAHSPLMAQDSLSENLAVVRQSGEHAKILNDPAVVRGWRLDQVVTSELFGLASARPPDVESFMNRRAALIDKEPLSEEEVRELEDLNERALYLPTADSPDDQRAMDIIREAARAIQEGQVS